MVKYTTSFTSKYTTSRTSKGPVSLILIERSKIGNKNVPWLHHLSYELLNGLGELTNQRPSLKSLKSVPEWVTNSS